MPEQDFKRKQRRCIEMGKTRTVPSWIPGVPDYVVCNKKDLPCEPGVCEDVDVADISVG